MPELFKFRCRACGKLLGAPARKVGRQIHCPQCGVEQVVPHPADAPDDDAEPTGDNAEDAIDLGDLGIDLGFSAASPLRPAEAPKAPRPPEGPDVGKLVAEFLQAAPTESDAANSPEPDDESSEAEPLVQPSTEPLVPGSRGRGRGRGQRPGAASPRPGRDVILPRTAVVAWSLFAILALGLSFVAGLMVGHYCWK